MKKIKENKVLIIFITSIILWVCFFSHCVNYNELGIIKNFKAEVDSLNKVNDSLYSDIKKNKVIIDKYTQEINLLENKKQTVIIKYKTKVNEIDSLNNNNLVAEFDSIFSKFNYK